MNVVSALVLFAVIWFVTLLVALPIGLTTQEEAGEVVPGTPASAPVDAMIRAQGALGDGGEPGDLGGDLGRHRLGRDHRRGYRCLPSHVNRATLCRIANQEGRRPMKILAALVTALTLVGFGGAALPTAPAI